MEKTLTILDEKDMQTLDPPMLWHRFYEMSRVPRPSKKEEKILAYLRNLAKKEGINLKEDEVGNIVMLIPATPGNEKAPTVVLQSHVDMVCLKTKESDHNFETDPIILTDKGDGWIRANQTTLGSDNGIGAATMLALITEKTFRHGPLELLFTVDEETGLTGAKSLKSDFLTGTVMLNLDTEDFGYFTVGCAGGQDTVGEISLGLTLPSEGYVGFEALISGLNGGHSGVEIHSGFSNAIKILSGFMDLIGDFDPMIGNIHGGTVRNSIPREANATLYVPASAIDQVWSIWETYEKDVRAKLVEGDKGFKFELKRSSSEPKSVINKAQSTTIIELINEIPHGVITMSKDIKGLVETSTNLATLRLDLSAKKLKLGTSQRSSVEADKRKICAEVKTIMEKAGAKVTQEDGYPGWQPNMQSQALKVGVAAYKKLFKAEPIVEAIHAGLECGLIGAKYPEMDMISFGPTIKGAHTPDERVEVKTVGDYYRLTGEILSRLAEG